MVLLTMPAGMKLSSLSAASTGCLYIRYSLCLPIWNSRRESRLLAPPRANGVGSWHARGCRL